MKSYIVIILTMLIAQPVRPSFDMFSEKPKGKPSVNFSGTIKTTDGQTIAVENMTISGKYEDIDLYKQPKNQKTDPTRFALFPDLADLKEITIHKGFFIYQPPASPRTKKFPKAKKYVQLTLIYKNGTKQKVVIPHGRRLWADQNIDGKLVEQKICFDALRHVTIKGEKTKSAKKEVNKKVIPQKAVVHDTEPTEGENIQHSAVQASFIRMGHILSQLTSAGKHQYDDLKDTLEQLWRDLKGSIDRAFS